MKTPHHGSQITKSWVEFFLTNHERKSNPNASVAVKTFDFTRATKPGESFNAELVKLDVVATLKSKEDPSCEEKEYSFIVKFLSQDPFSREMIKKIGYHLREFRMYSSVVEDFNKFQEDKAQGRFPINLPQYIYGKCNPNEYVLVMENIKVIGYSTNPKEKGLDIEQTRMAIEHIARLHGISYAYDKTFDFLSKYPSFRYSSVVTALFKPVVYASLNNVIKFLNTKSELKDILSKLESGMRTLPEKFNNLWEDQSRHRIKALTHGDFWNSNLMFHYGKVGENGTQQLEDLKIIDWQISLWGNPVMDLHYLINTSTTRSLRSNHLDELLHLYYNKFVEITASLGSPIENFSYEEFRTEFDRVSLVGLLMGICLIQGTLSKAGEKINRQESVHTSNTCNPFHSLFFKAKTLAAKIIVPIAFCPSSQFVLKVALKKLLSPIADELIKGENEVMNSRLIDLLLEAEEKGLLDVLNL